MKAQNASSETAAWGIARELLSPDSVAVTLGTNTDRWNRALSNTGATIFSPPIDQVPCLERFLYNAAVKHVRLLCLDGEIVIEALLGIERLLNYARIDAITVSNMTPQLFREIRRMLGSKHYAFFRVEQAGLAPAAATEQFADHDLLVAIHSRLLPLVFGLPKKMLDIQRLCRDHRIAPTGVIHVGAHQGAEWRVYANMGAVRVLFIEANPDLCIGLTQEFAGRPEILVENCAIVDRPGPIKLRIASNDQSSSVLPMSLHRAYYPQVVEKAMIEVPGKTLDGLLAELHLSPALFNLMNMDIQGAELLALKGATEVLSHIAAINLEVNFEELYEGCCQIEDVDDFLVAHKFRRAAMTCPYHQSWGDAFYVRSRS